MEGGVEDIDGAVRVGGVEVGVATAGADGEAGVAGGGVVVLGDGGGTAVPAKNRAGLGREDEVGGLAVAVGEEEAGGIAVIDLTGWASGDGDGQRVDCRSEEHMSDLESPC